MITKKSRGKTYYYIEKYGRLQSLKMDKSTAEKLLQKKKLQQEQNKIKNNLHWTQRLASHYMALPASDASWDNMEPNQNTYKQEERIHLYNGTYYRSKSEAAIAALLSSYRIPFKYEVKFEFNGYAFYPDFYIRRPKDGKIFLWEHFGLITSEPYVQKTFHKLNDYHNHGYNLWDNLLISFDQENGSIHMDTIDKIIQTFLL